MRVLSNIKYWFSKFDFLRAYNSPFVRPKISLYFGDVSRGVPYFLPRRWVLMDRETAYLRAFNEVFESPRHVNYGKDVFEVFDKYLKTRVAVPKRFGFDFVGLGYKTKWSDTDYRHEYSPVWSFVFFGKQLCLYFITPNDDSYWECWLYYTRNTSKKDSVRNRIAQARANFHQTYTVHRSGEPDKSDKVDYWDHVLKPKYVK